jgi:hypothetical protein
MNSINKIAFVFILCFSIITKGYSGDTTSLNKSNRYIVSVSVGPAIPFLNFGVPGSAPSKSQYDSSFYGYAETGFHFAVNADVLITKHFGITGSICGNLNAFNTTAYDNYTLYNEPGTTTVTADNYYTGEYMFGCVVYDTYSSKHSNLLVVFTLMGGYIRTNFPTIITNYQATSTQSTGQSTLSANTAHSFVGDISVGLHDKINKHIIVSLDCSFSFTYMDFSSGLYTETIQGSPPLTTTPGNPLSMWVGLFKPALGVGYIF